MGAGQTPLILVSNDDGVAARGNVALREAMEGLGEVVTVAPEREQSAGSHAITLDRPLRHRVVAPNVHSVDGTPADCIYVALFHEPILPRRPTIVVSGINHGPNLASDVFYSGTVAAAREAAIRGIPAIAFSQMGKGDFELSARIARGIVQRVIESVPPPGRPVLFNVNFPQGHPKGIRATRLGSRTYDDVVTARRDPRGREYLWIGGPNAYHAPREHADTEAVDQGYVSVSPLLLEATNPDHFGIAAYAAAAEIERAENP